MLESKDKLLLNKTKREEKPDKINSNKKENQRNNKPQNKKLKEKLQENG